MGTPRTRPMPVMTAAVAAQVTKDVNAPQPPPVLPTVRGRSFSWALQLSFDAVFVAGVEAWTSPIDVARIRLEAQ